MPEHVWRRYTQNDSAGSNTGTVMPIGLYYIRGAHWSNLANMIEPSAWRRYGLMSNYFDHMLFAITLHLTNYDVTNEHL